MLEGTARGMIECSRELVYSNLLSELLKLCNHLHAWVLR